MKQFEARLSWERGEHAFTDLRYSRAHAWQFDGGLAALHHAAHDRCYIANSLKGEIVVEGLD
jgi:hypothetical protein